FTQSGGTNSLTSFAGFFNIGSGAGSNGTYVLNGGTLTSNAPTAVGYDGTGSFNQTGGTHSANQLSLATHNINSIGNYTLSAGTLTVGTQLYVGQLGTATFDQ